MSFLLCSSTAAATTTTSVAAAAVIILHIVSVTAEVRTWGVDLRAIRNEMRGTVYAAIERSTRIWNGWSCVHIMPTEDFQSANIQIEFFRGSHANDKYPFDDIGGVIGHTFYPIQLPNKMTRSQIHLDLDDINRLFSDDIELSALVMFDRVIAHEIGHSLGLVHSATNSHHCIMSMLALANPSYYYVPCMSDVYALQYIYGSCNSKTNKKHSLIQTMIKVNLVYLHDGMLYRFIEYFNPEHVLKLQEIFEAKQLLYVDYENATQLYENSRYMYLFYDNRMCGFSKKNPHRTWCYFYSRWMPPPHTTSMHIRGVVKFRNNTTTSTIYLLTQTHVYALMENNISKTINPNTLSIFRLPDWLRGGSVNHSHSNSISSSNNDGATNIDLTDDSLPFRYISSGHYLYIILINGRRYKVYRWSPAAGVFIYQHENHLI